MDQTMRRSSKSLWRRVNASEIILNGFKTVQFFIPLLNFCFNSTPKTHVGDQGKDRSKHDGGI